MTSSRDAQEGNRRKSEAKRKPTAHQKRFLNTIRRLTKESGGMPPTLIEVASACGVTKATAQTQVRRMRERGWILPSNGTHRNIRVA